MNQFSLFDTIPAEPMMRRESVHEPWQRTAQEAIDHVAEGGKFVERPNFIRRSRIENPASSHLAAAEIEETAESQCAKILEVVKAHPDKTTQELHVISRWSVHTLGRRLPELRSPGKGLVMNPTYGEGRDATKMRRCTVQNRLALTWRAV